MLKKSKYNIFSKIYQSDYYLLVNLLHGNADLLDTYEAQIFSNFDKGLNIDENLLTLFVNKGYIIDEIEEKKLFVQKYLNFIDDRETDEIQVFFVLNYSCNFNCKYCYQTEYPILSIKHNLKDVIDNFFEYFFQYFAGRKKYVTLFGGEPLLMESINNKYLNYFIEKIVKYNIELAVVTNGYYLEEYLPLLTKASIREIQVTLDGTKEVHDYRRFLKNGIGTFEKIIAGIDKALELNIPINLRVVVDKDNLANLPNLAQYSIEKGWTKLAFFKTQIGRNYELHSCYSSADKLFTRAELYIALYHLIEKYPEVLEFHRPAFSISKFLWENEQLPEPLFDSCPACKTEWAFDYTGKIYPCTATVGKKGEELGTFYPIVTLDNKRIEKWATRDITTIEQCNNCSLQLACGGGCGSVAKNRTGNIHTVDCRPINTLLELGFSHYFKSIIASRVEEK